MNLLAAIALLVWGTHIVRSGVLRVYGTNLRQVLRRSVGNRGTSFIAGVGVTGLLQSSTATALLASSFVSQGMTLLPGDVLTTGTPPGVGPLAAGDILEIEIEGVGILRNPVAG